MQSQPMGLINTIWFKLASVGCHFLPGLIWCSFSFLSFQPVLFIMCAGNELFYCMLYLLCFGEGPESEYRKLRGLREGETLGLKNMLDIFPPHSFLFFCFPVLSGYAGLYRLILWVCTPIAITKSFISLIHLVSASCNMAALDVAERAKKM